MMQPKTQKGGSILQKPQVGAQEVEEPCQEFIPLEVPLKKRSLTADDQQDDFAKTAAGTTQSQELTLSDRGGEGRAQISNSDNKSTTNHQANNVDTTSPSRKNNL